VKCPRCNYPIRLKPRSPDSNALQHVWFEQVARESGEDSPAGIKRFCKLEFGCPILCAENEIFQRYFDRYIEPMPREDQLDAMNFLNVSSVMTSGQMSRYMKDIQYHYGQRGIVLESNREEPSEP